jgi:hypothetical protein
LPRGGGSDARKHVFLHAIIKSGIDTRLIPNDLD